MRKVEKEVLVPRMMEYKINHELCNEENRLFAECAEKNGLMVVVRCREVFNTFKACSNRWFKDEAFQKEMEKEYMQKRDKFRDTGEATKSPFGRL